MGASSVLVQKVKFVIQILLFSAILFLKFVQTPLRNAFCCLFKIKFFKNCVLFWSRNGQLFTTSWKILNVFKKLMLKFKTRKWHLLIKRVVKSIFFSSKHKLLFIHLCSISFFSLIYFPWPPSTYSFTTFLSYKFLKIAQHSS